MIDLSNEKKDLIFIKKFFENPEIKTSIEEIKKNIKLYKKYRDFLIKRVTLLLIPILLLFIYKLWHGSPIIISIPFIYIYLLIYYRKQINFHENLEWKIMGILFFFGLSFYLIVSIIIFSIFIYLILSKIFGKIYKKDTKIKDTYKEKIIQKNIESFVMPKFAKYIHVGLNFSIEDKLFEVSDNTLIRKGLIKSYDRLKERKNSISLDYQYKNKSLLRKVKLNGVRIVTEHESTYKNTVSYNVNNNCYIYKISFNRPKYKINKEIKVLKDFHEKHIFLSKLGFKKKNRITLENKDFEKYFDVYCEDQITAREVLTPDFMYKIYDFTKKFEFKRKFEFYFHKSHIYIKYDIHDSKIKGNLGNKSIFKIKHISYYQNFYTEIKNILSLIEDLEIFYYTKSSVTKNKVN